MEGVKENTASCLPQALHTVGPQPRFSEKAPGHRKPPRGGAAASSPSAGTRGRAAPRPTPEKSSPLEDGGRAHAGTWKLRDHCQRHQQRRLFTRIPECSAGGISIQIPRGLREPRAAGAGGSVPGKLTKATKNGFKETRRHARFLKCVEALEQTELDEEACLPGSSAEFPEDTGTNSAAITAPDADSPLCQTGLVKWPRQHRPLWGE